MSKSFVRVFAAVMLAVMLLSACAPAVTPTAQAPAQTEPTKAAATTAPEASQPTATTAAAEQPAAAEPTAAQPAKSGEKVYLTELDQLSSTWVRNFNPFSPNALGPTTRTIYEPMMIYNTATGKIVPWLATEYKFNEDNTVLTFKIRPDVKWSDGQPMTAKDVVYTFDLLKSNAALSGSATSVLNDYVESYSAPDDNTVEFKFKKVYTLALYDLMAQVIVPEHIWKDVKDPSTFTNDNPVATGPFTQVATFENQIYILEKNPNYWQPGKPAFDGLKFSAYPGNDQGNLSIINGEVDWGAAFIPDIEKTYVAKDPENNHFFFGQGGGVFLYVNLHKKPWDDPEVRKAVSMGIDRQMIADVGEYGYTVPLDATGLSTDLYKNWKSEEAVKAGTWANYDPKAAEAKLDELGYKKGADGIRVGPDGKPMKFELIAVSGWTDWIASCQIIAQNLKDIGIDVSVQTPEYNTWYDELSKGTFDMAISWSSGGATPYNFYRGMMSKLSSMPEGDSAGENWQRYVNEDADKLLEEFATTSDEAKQREIMNQVQMLFVNNAPAIPLFPGPDWYEYNTTRFTGFPTKDNFYAPGPAYLVTALIVLTTITPK